MIYEVQEIIRILISLTLLLPLLLLLLLLLPGVFFNELLLLAAPLSPAVFEPRPLDVTAGVLLAGDRVMAGVLGASSWEGCPPS